MYSQDVAINEVMSSNETTIADEDGEFEDWIEIYNYGSTPVNIGGYGLTDDSTNLFQWVFPAYTLQPKEFLLVWASGKDKTIPSEPLHSNFKIKTGGEDIILTNSGGTQINNVPVVAIDSDLSYARQPDGTGSWKFFSVPTPNQSNSGTPNTATEKIAINEIMNSNDSEVSDEDGDFNDWIEIYNYGTTTVNLNGYGLSDDSTLSFKWTFPAISIAPNQYILVWASDKNKAIAGQSLHTNFKIGSAGETIFLKNPAGILVSGSPSIGLNSDISFGRQPDGTGSWFFFDTPTPGASNIGNGSTSTLEPPTFSHTSGLYTSNFDLALSTETEGATIVYTLDGSEPDINNLSGTSFTYKNDYPFEIGEPFGAFLNETYISKVYSSPITIVDRSNDPDKLANKNTSQTPLYVPPTPVRKATVIKARTFLNGKGSKIISKTFFVWSGGNPYNTPIVSLQLNEESLFGYDNGIYTSGVDFDTWRTSHLDGAQGIRPENNNYWRSGIDSEKPVNVEFFDENLQSVMNLNAGLRIHGNTSRLEVIKALRLYARSEYGDKNIFEHNLFD